MLSNAKDDSLFYSQGGASNDDHSKNTRLNGIQQPPQFVMDRQRCLLVDRNSLEFSKKFVPPMKSQIAMAAYQNKNGFRITCKPFTVFKNLAEINKPHNLFKYLRPEARVTKGPAAEEGNYFELGKDIDLSEGDEQFKIRFVDFSQRRKIGFRGAFEFENKHIMIASQS